MYCQSRLMLLMVWQHNARLLFRNICLHVWNLSTSDTCLHCTAHSRCRQHLQSTLLQCLNCLLSSFLSCCIYTNCVYALQTVLSSPNLKSITENTGTVFQAQLHAVTLS